MNQTINNENITIPLWQPVVFAAMAGGMAWGIRGQYGHETGAMIAGLLVGFTLVFLLAPKLPLLHAARAAALCTIAMGFGGSMTYGQTVGLTHDQPLDGNWEALRWGLLGLAIKGGIWISFAGAFLGMALSGVRYRPIHYTVIMLGMVGFYFLGGYLLNSPYDPSQKVLPYLYFSDDWYWEPGSDLTPRPECWGGMLLALAALFVYVTWFRGDTLASLMTLWGYLGGAVGFPAGQCLQAYHAWNRDWFAQGWLAEIDPYINWWNMMETTFGTIMGATLGLGLWLNRSRIATTAESATVYLTPTIEALLLLVHLAFLIPVEFMSIGFVDAIYDTGLIMGVIPVIMVAGGRYSPFLTVFPVTLIPIGGKTIRQLVYEEAVAAPLLGWMIYLIIPLILCIGLAIWFANQSKSNAGTGRFLMIGLMFNTWLYFLLNWCFFRFPWVWAEWTTRTPNGLIFTIYAIGLTVAVWMNYKKSLTFNSLEKNHV